MPPVAIAPPRVSPHFFLPYCHVSCTGAATYSTPDHFLVATINFLVADPLLDAGNVKFLPQFFLKKIYMLVLVFNG